MFVSVMFYCLFLLQLSVFFKKIFVSFCHSFLSSPCNVLYCVCVCYAVFVFATAFCLFFVTFRVITVYCSALCLFCCNFQFVVLVTVCVITVFVFVTLYLLYCVCVCYSFLSLPCNVLHCTSASHQYHGHLRMEVAISISCQYLCYIFSTSTYNVQLSLIFSTSTYNVQISLIFISFQHLHTME